MIHEFVEVDGTVRGRQRYKCAVCGIPAFAGKDGQMPRGVCKTDAQPKPCPHRGEQVGEVGCGCGARDKKVPVFACAVLDYCTINSTGKRNKIAGKPVAVCLGCPSNPDGAT
jgi:hypothetical protein